MASQIAAKAATAAVNNMSRRAALAELRNTYGVVNMPTRAIAAVLLRAKAAVPHEELFERANEYSLFHSKRHFKHCLKMMKLQKRVRVICNGPQYPGASRLAFSIELTRRGGTIYTRYLGEEPPLPQLQDNEDGAPGLGDAI